MPHPSHTPTGLNPNKNDSLISYDVLEDVYGTTR